MSSIILSIEIPCFWSKVTKSQTNIINKLAIEADQRQKEYQKYISKILFKNKKKSNQKYLKYLDKVISILEILVLSGIRYTGFNINEDFNLKLDLDINRKFIENLSKTVSKINSDKEHDSIYHEYISYIVKIQDYIDKLKPKLTTHNQQLELLYQILYNYYRALALVINNKKELQKESKKLQEMGFLPKINENMLGESNIKFEVIKKTGSHIDKKYQGQMSLTI